MPTLDDVDIAPVQRGDLSRGVVIPGPGGLGGAVGGRGQGSGPAGGRPTGDRGGGPAGSRGGSWQAAEEAAPLVVLALLRPLVRARKNRHG
jgi:hypothetical protein